MSAVTPGHRMSPLAESLDYAKPAPRASLSMKITLDDGRVLDDTWIRLERFSGHESISQPFDFDLECHVNELTSSGGSYDPNQPRTAAQRYVALAESNSLATELDFEQIIGAEVTVMLGLPETEKDVANQPYPEARPNSYWHGIVSNLAVSGRGIYHIKMKPALFELGHQSRYRLFSQQTILEVISTVLKENKIDFTAEPLVNNPGQNPGRIVAGLATYRKQDWLQAGETDLQFITRLMGKVSLFYYFVHEADRHLMVITDQDYYQPINVREVDEDGETRVTEQLKPLYLSFTEIQGYDRDDYIKAYRYQRNLTTSGVSTVLAQKESVWESQDTAVASPVYVNDLHSAPQRNMEQMHLVQYGATEDEVNALTRSSVRKLRAGMFELSGQSSCAELKPGYFFEVRETTDRDADPASLPMRPELNERQFVATSVQHQASAEGDYSNSFSAVDRGGIATPFEASQENQGSILAFVTEAPAASQKGGGGRIRNFARRVTEWATLKRGSGEKYLPRDTFAYDNKDFRYSIDGKDSVYSCRGIFVRFVDQPDDAPAHWVKLAEHMQTIPEIGTCVVVGRARDDTEIPEVQQTLQAKGSRVIMPDNYTTNTNVGDSYSTGYGNSTRINFGWDVNTPLSTAKNIVEEKRKSNQYNDVSYGESSSYGYNVSPRSHHVSLTGSGSPPPVADPDGKDPMSYVQYGRSITRGDTYQSSETVGNAESRQKTVGNNKNNMEQTGNTDSTSRQEGDSISRSTHIGTATSESFTVAQNGTSTVGKSDNTNTVGQSSNLSATGISDSVSATGIQRGISTTGISENLSVNGISVGGSVTGMSTNLNVAGLSASTSATGISSSDSLTGTSMQTSVTGSSTSASVVGSSMSVSATGMSISASATGMTMSDSVVGFSYSNTVGGANLVFDTRPSNTQTKPPFDVNINVGILIVM